MSQFEIMALSEVALLVFGALCVIIWIIWQRKKRQALALESLLEEVKATEAERKKKLIRHLTVKRKLNEIAATELSQELLQAEKQFLQFYLRYQFEQGAGAEFYVQLTELLDQYLKRIPVPEPIVATIVNSERKQQMTPGAASIDLPVTAVLDAPDTLEKLPAELDLTSDSFDSFMEEISAPEPEGAQGAKEEISLAKTDAVDEFGGEDIDWGDAFSQTEDTHANENKDEAK